MVKALDIDLAATGYHHPDRVLPLMASKLADVGKAAAQDIGLSERRILTGLLLLKSSRS